VHLQWPNIDEFTENEDDDMPKEGALIESFCYRICDLGLPVSEDGMKICEHLEKEMDKRDQEIRMMHIYSDWNGWGMGEVMENLVGAV
jgi:hypothetical protein